MRQERARSNPGTTEETEEAEEISIGNSESSSRPFFSASSVSSVVFLILLWFLQSGFACTSEHYLDMQDVDVPAPTPEHLEMWRQEAWRRDPRQVAHHEIQMRLDVPWKGEAFHPGRYEFHEKNAERPDWGSYVVRGFNDRGGRTTRYRVKVKRAGDLWYAVQVSHYMIARLPHPALEPDDGPPRTK